MKLIADYEALIEEQWNNAVEAAKIGKLTWEEINVLAELVKQARTLFSADELHVVGIYRICLRVRLMLKIAEEMLRFEGQDTFSKKDFAELME